MLENLKKQIKQGTSLKAGNKHVENIFVIETCLNCKQHEWNTRHDEQKYADYFKNVAKLLIENIPNAMIMKNQIPKSYFQFDLYNNLVPNEEQDTPYFQQVPRTGAFELSYQGILIFSKIKSGGWPEYDQLLSDCKQVVKQYEIENNHTLTFSIPSQQPPSIKSFMSPVNQSKPKTPNNAQVTIGDVNAIEEVNSVQTAKTGQKANFIGHQNVAITDNASELRTITSNDSPSSILKQKKRVQSANIYGRQTQMPPKSTISMRHSDASFSEYRDLLKRSIQRNPFYKMIKTDASNQFREPSIPVVLPIQLQRQKTVRDKEDIKRKRTEKIEQSRLKMDKDQEIEAGPHIRSIANITGFVNFPKRDTSKGDYNSISGSILSKVLTKEIFDKYRFVQDSQNIFFESNILPGCQDLQSVVGVIAPSQDAYTVFSDLYDKIVYEYHGYNVFDSHQTTLGEIDAASLVELKVDDESLIYQTCIKIERNLDYKLLGTKHLKRHDRIHVEQTLAKGINNVENGKYYSFSDKLSVDDQDRLKDAQKSAIRNYYRFDFPLTKEDPGRGFFHNESDDLFMWVNALQNKVVDGQVVEEQCDHLRMISIERGAKFSKCFKKIAKACREIEEFIDFAYDDHLGHINACPSNLGTGMKISVIINLEILGQNQSTLWEVCCDQNLIYRKIQLNIKDSYLYEISNKTKLGKSEVQIIKDFYVGIQALIKAQSKIIENKREQEKMKAQFEAEQAQMLAAKQAQEQAEKQKQQEAEQKENVAPNAAENKQENKENEAASANKPAEGEAKKDQN